MFEPDPSFKLPLLALPPEVSPSFVRALHLAAVLRTGNFKFGTVELAPYAQPINADALQVAFDRCVQMTVDTNGVGPFIVSIWRAATIGERYLRLVQLAAMALAAAEEVAIEIDRPQSTPWLANEAALDAAIAATETQLPCDVEA
jgi:hypothetical protein